VLQRRARVEAVTLDAVRRFVPQFFDGPLSLILPSQEWLRSADPLLAERWRPLAFQIEDYCGSDAYRGDRILLEPYVTETAALFRRAR
jgi:hypothetical protein